MKPKNYHHTIAACFVGYVVQAVVINFAPLLFVTLGEEFSIGLDRISAMITLTFGLQLLIDYCAPTIIGKMGYRTAGVAAQIFSVSGLICLALLPRHMAHPYAGLLLATTLYSIGGGLDEVIVSTLVELCPTDRKAGMMSLLHSFYCWGQLLTVLLSTVFFLLFGLQNWHVLALLWAIVPAIDGVLFATAPIPEAKEETMEAVPRRKLFGNGRFWIFALIMVCGGASELCISQWASAFAQTALGVNKTVGDLAGPCAFALLMGLARVFYAKCSEKLRAPVVMALSAVLCIGSYLLAALSPIPLLGLLGCALAGFSVGVFWPCTLSFGASQIAGGVTLFSLLALFGDLGCTSGPTLVGLVADRFGGNLKAGVLVSLIFPVLLLAGVFSDRLCRMREAQKNASGISGEKNKKI